MNYTFYKNKEQSNNIIGFTLISTYLQLNDVDYDDDGTIISLLLHQN